MTIPNTIRTLEERQAFLLTKPPTNYVRAEIAALETALGVLTEVQYDRRCTRAAKHAINLLLPGCSC